MFTRWILLFVLVIWRLASSDADYSHNSRDNLVEDSSRTCPNDGIPVCGVRGKDYFLFPNQCLLDEVNKDILLGMTNFKKLPMSRCIHGCRLMCPKVYKPICALNMHTQERKVFVSLCELTEYACKTNMDYIKLNINDCEPMEILTTSQKTLGKRSKKLNRRPVPCTDIFKPVCGTYLGVKSTFRNECFLNAENVKFGKDWRMVKSGICDEDYSKSRQHVHNKAHNKPHSIRKRSYDNNNYIHYQHENTFMGYQPQQLPMDYKPQMDMPSMDPYSHIYTMPQIFQTPYHQVNPVSSNFETEDVIQKIISLPQPDNHDSAQEEDQEFEATDMKPMHFSMNNMDFNYMPAMRAMSAMNDNLENTAQESAIDSYEENDINRGDYYYPYNQPAPTYDTEEMPEVAERTMITTTSTEIPATTTTSEEYIMSIPITTAKSVTPDEVKESVNEQTFKTSIPCKFGESQICGVLSNGTVHTFETICEMMTKNIYLKSTFVKLHEGRCESCKYNCSREYNPICVQRNGVNYTMVNDCYYNMGICMDKISKWSKISDGECQRYTRIPDKYEYIQPGFKYTSSYFVSNSTSTTEMSIPTTTTEVATEPNLSNISEMQSSEMEATVETTTSEPTKKTKRIKNRKMNSKRVVRRRSNWSHNNPAFTNVPLPNLVPLMDTYIMNLVKSKGGRLSQ